MLSRLGLPIKGAPKHATSCRTALWVLWGAAVGQRWHQLSCLTPVVALHVLGPDALPFSPFPCPSVSPVLSAVVPGVSPPNASTSVPPIPPLEGSVPHQCPPDGLLCSLHSGKQSRQRWVLVSEWCCITTHKCHVNGTL